MNRVRQLLLAVAFWCVSLVAGAHPAPFSYLDLHLDADGVHGTLVVHDFDAAYELGIAEPRSLMDASVAKVREPQLLRILDSRLMLLADGQRLAPQWGGLAVLPQRQSLSLPFTLATRSPGRLDVHTILFPYDRNHQTFVNIYEAGQLKHQAILSATNARLTYYTGSAPGRWAVVKTFVASGIHHILIGPDHILFLVGLLLLGGSLWRLASIVTAFTIGHSITLSLAALDHVQIAPGIIEPAIALSIVVVGVDNLLVRSRGQTAGRDLRPWLAAAFGLIHGFGFAAVLLEFGLPREALGWSLAAFNVGVEIGQLAIVLTLAALLAAIRRHNVLLAQRCVVIGSAAVIAAGLYWFVQRVWFATA